MLESNRRDQRSLSLNRRRAKPQRLRVAIKVKGKILFINLHGVVSVQSYGRHVAVHQTSGSYLLRDSISAVVEILEIHGSIRIHRSVLVNTLFVQEIWPVSTGTYCPESWAKRNSQSPVLTRKI